MKRKDRQSASSKKDGKKIQKKKKRRPERLWKKAHSGLCDTLFFIQLESKFKKKC